MPDVSWTGNSPQFQSDAAHSGYNTAPGPSGEVSEHFTITGSDVSKVRSPAVVDGVAYVTMGGTRDGTTFTALGAYNVPAGEQIWEKRIEGSSVDDVPTTPTVDDGTVFFGSGEKLYAYDAKSGEREWAKAHSFESGTDPTVADGYVLIEDNTKLYAVEAKSGTEAWKFTPQTTEYTVFVRSPSIADGTVYVAASNLEAVELQSGKRKWRAEFPARTMASPTVGENAVYVGTETGNVYAFPRDGGKQYWKKSVSEYIKGVETSMAIGNGTVVVRKGKRSGLVALNADDGSKQWKRRAITMGPPVVSKGSVYVRDKSKLMALSLEDGSKQWKYKQPTAKGSLSAPVVSGRYGFGIIGEKKLVVVSGSG